MDHSQLPQMSGATWYTHRVPPAVPTTPPPHLHWCAVRQVVADSHTIVVNRSDGAVDKVLTGNGNLTGNLQTYTLGGETTKSTSGMACEAEQGTDM